MAPPTVFEQFNAVEPPPKRTPARQQASEMFVMAAVFGGLVLAFSGVAAIYAFSSGVVPGIVAFAVQLGYLLVPVGWVAWVAALVAEHRSTETKRWGTAAAIAVLLVVASVVFLFLALLFALAGVFGPMNDSM